MTSVLPWLNCPEIKELNIATISISTKNIFYGYILIFYPPLEYSDSIFRKKNGEESEAIRELKKFIVDTYAPALCLFENYWEESILKKELDTTPNWGKYIFLNEKLQESSDKIESGLAMLWKTRKSFFENHKPGAEASQKVRDSLLFSKYLVASSTMISEMKNIIIPRPIPSKPKEKSILPCALVIGGPGSGKDDIARIIHLFFPEYRFGKIHTLNMASLKPNYFTVPLLSGFASQITGNINVNGSGSEINIEAHLKGVFAKIWEGHKKKYPTEKEMQKACMEGDMPVIILDELNSLDIDAQGALLRILQNAEIQALGSSDTEKVDFLVIGIVNEPEHTLTLEEPLRKFIMEKNLFGGVLGRVLYEYFRNIRRLRDDLYYRLVRDGKFKLLDLDERTEEIPILFAFFVKKELDVFYEDTIGWDNIWFDFDVFEELMNKSISWTGNFRQLQSLAKRVSSNVLQDQENKKQIDKILEGDKDSYIHISLDHLRDVLQEFFQINI
jgi:hypothetical protein